MSWPTPFTYPETPHFRRHGPSGYKNYQDYKPWLRDDFTFRCVYCLERERWYPNEAASFSVEHIEPRSISPHRIGVYDNMVYACLRCNTGRQDALVLDPTRTALRDHLRVSEDGRIHGLTSEGQDVIDILALNATAVVRQRRRIFSLLTLKVRHPDDPDVHQLFLDAFGYPEDLPDLLALRPPTGNTQEETLNSCYHARRDRQELGDVY